MNAMHSGTSIAYILEVCNDDDDDDDDISYHINEWDGMESILAEHIISMQSLMAMMLMGGWGMYIYIK